MDNKTALDHFSIKELLELNTGEQREFAVDLTKDEAEKLLVQIGSAPLHFTIAMTRIDDGILCQISATAEMPLECSRCLIVFDQTISAETSQEYSDSKELTEDQYPIHRDLTIDLMQQAIDTIIPAIPHYPLHAKDCRGLCTTCGVNLNDQPDHLTQHPDHIQSPQLANPIKIK